MPLYVRTLLVTGSPDEVEPAAVKHREHLRGLHRKGQLHVAGEFTNGDGFLEILIAADRIQAESISRSSPLIEAGLATWLLREWDELDLDG